MVTARELQLGGVERHGEHVRIVFRSGAYLIIRHPDKGHAIESTKYLKDARAIARYLSHD